MPVTHVPLAQVRAGTNEVIAQDLLHRAARSRGKSQDPTMEISRLVPATKKWGPVTGGPVTEGTLKAFQKPAKGNIPCFVNPLKNQNHNKEIPNKSFPSPHS